MRREWSVASPYLTQIRSSNALNLINVVFNSERVEKLIDFNFASPEAVLFNFA